MSIVDLSSWRDEVEGKEYFRSPPHQHLRKIVWSGRADDFRTFVTSGCGSEPIIQSFTTYLAHGPELMGDSRNFPSTARSRIFLFLASDATSASLRLQEPIFLSPEEHPVWQADTSNSACNRAWTTSGAGEARRRALFMFRLFFFAGRHGACHSSECAAFACKLHPDEPRLPSGREHLGNRCRNGSASPKSRHLSDGFGPALQAPAKRYDHESSGYGKLRLPLGADSKCLSATGGSSGISEH